MVVVGVVVSVVVVGGGGVDVVVVVVVGVVVDRTLIKTMQTKQQSDTHDNTRRKIQNTRRKWQNMSCSPLFVMMSVL